MTDLTTNDVKALFALLAQTFQRERDALCQLDGIIGDGDHGLAMEQGMLAAHQAVQACDGPFQDQFNAAAKGFLNAVGASSGPLYATAFLRAAKALGPVMQQPRDPALRAVIVAMRDGIAHRGKAQPGQKTMLDCWHPAAEACLAGSNAAAIRQAAHTGAESTRDMVAGMGRAERLGERARGHIDPGADSARIILDALVACMADARP